MELPVLLLISGDDNKTTWLAVCRMRAEVSLSAAAVQVIVYPWAFCKNLHLGGNKYDPEGRFCAYHDRLCRTADAVQIESLFVSGGSGYSMSVGLEVGRNGVADLPF